MKPELRDAGTGFCVDLPRDACIDDLDDGPGFKYLKIRSKKSADSPDSEESDGLGLVPRGIPAARVFDYSVQNEKYKRQQLARQAARKAHDQELDDAIAEDAPDPEFRSYRILNALQGASGPNKVVEEFFKRSKDGWLKTVWSGLHGEGKFPCDAPLVQLFNPQAAKGYGLLKPTGTDRNDKTKEKWAEPFLEWLRYRGFFASCAGWFLGNKGEHIRLYCPMPGKISFDLYRRVATDFRAESLSGSATKMDCLGTLRLTRILIERSEILSRPARSIRGLWVVYYQSMGQAKAVTSIDQLFVPDWFESKQSGELWLETLEEHDRVLRRLDDAISEELTLLKKYRRFLQQREGDALPDFVDFLSAYGHHVFQQRGQGKWLLPQLSEDKVEAILQARYKDIIENPGFQAISGALRAATVSAQVAKRNAQRTGGDYRDVQYGALPELRRKLSLDPDEFMQAVSDFIAGFNAESARRNENNKSGFRVSQDEFAAFAALMDEAPSELVGSLLCAVATCKRGKDEKEEAE
jgi:hypothetical protein